MVPINCPCAPMVHLSAAAEGQAMASLPLFSTKQPSFTRPIHSEAFCKTRVLEWSSFSRTRFSEYREIRVSGCSKTRASRCCNGYYNARVSKCSSGEMFSSSTSQLSLHVVNCTSKVGATESGSSSSPYLEAADVVEREEGMPIPGTITFRRSSTQTHYEFLTDLETLGMENFSSELSRSVAFSMGIQASVKSEPPCTPAAISIDVTKEGQDLRLDGIVRTSMALNCCRCGVPVGERVFGEFSLLLTEKPVVEPTKQCVGVVLGDVGRMPDDGEDLDEILDLDLDDKLHFPRTEKSIDISKYIRDTVHLEIPLQCLCALGCRGKCFDCGVNLNKGTCICDINAQKEDRRAMWGPLDQLKKQLESEGEA